MPLDQDLVVKRRLRLTRQFEDEEDKEALCKVFQEQSKNIVSSASLSSSDRQNSTKHTTAK